MSKIEQARQNLKDFKRILDDLGIVFWLDGGTLLGAYRDQTFCQDDETDIDLCTWINYLALAPELKKAALEKEFFINEWPTEIAFIRNTCKIDLFFNDKKEDKAFTFLYDGTKKLPVVIPSRFYEELDLIDFLGMQFNRPRDIERYLELKYGDWRTPIHRNQYSCYDPEKNRLVDTSFQC